MQSTLASRKDQLDHIEHCRERLQSSIRQLLSDIGDVQIGTPRQFPLGWRKAAKGRTVWRLLEELISQNLETTHERIGFHTFAAADSEVGVYDFKFSFADSSSIYVNVKSSVKGGRTNKDDISKARLLERLYTNEPDCILFIATIELQFLDTMALRLCEAHVVPVSWLPDIYVNPSNNGNLQSSKYKDIRSALPRTNSEFLDLLRKEIDAAEQKRLVKRQ